uniref:BED-type domain-containing protein n=1 Tax=Noccaea caerulescens TaxID=107243 RepID=A0A1J3EE64_NOCCA
MLTEATSTVEPVKGKRKTSKVWKHFKPIGQKYPDGRSDIRCNHCNYTYCIDLKKGTTTLLRHMRACLMTPGNTTPTCGNRKLDMLVFREMIAVAIIEHNLPYSFVEYRRIREAFVYANSNIEFWSRNTAAADCLKIFEKEKRKLREWYTPLSSFNLQWNGGFVFGRI